MLEVLVRAPIVGSPRRATPTPKERAAVIAWKPEFVAWTADGGAPRNNAWRACVATWEALGAPKEVLSWIRHGYAPPRHAELAPSWFANARVTNNHEAFVDRQILALLQAGHLRPWNVLELGIPTCVVPLSVAEGDKLRLIFDERYPNLCELLGAFRSHP